jgi:hypothetical protein
MKEQVKKKLEYYTKQYHSAIERYLKDNKRVSRDVVIKCQERMKVYQEVLELKN